MTLVASGLFNMGSFRSFVAGLGFLAATATGAAAATMTVTTDTGGALSTYMSWDALDVTFTPTDGAFFASAGFATSEIRATALDDSLVRVENATVTFFASNGLETLSQSATVRERYSAKVDDTIPGCFCYFGDVRLTSDLMFDFANGEQLIIQATEFGRTGGRNPFYQGAGELIYSAPLEIRYSYTAPAPVPLPAGGWLLLVGLGAFAAAKRRQRTA
jgi:hypothetical protein